MRIHHHHWTGIFLLAKDLSGGIERQQHGAVIINKTYPVRISQNGGGGQNAEWI